MNVQKIINSNVMNGGISKIIISKYKLINKYIHLRYDKKLKTDIELIQRLTLQN